MLSSRDLEEMVVERGLRVDHTSISRLPCSAMPRNSKSAVGLISAACNDSWKVDETYIKIKKIWMYLYRAIDSEGNTLEFLLSPARDAEAAKRFARQSVAVHCLFPFPCPDDREAGGSARGLG